MSCHLCFLSRRDGYFGSSRFTLMHQCVEEMKTKDQHFCEKVEQCRRCSPRFGEWLRRNPSTIYSSWSIQRNGGANKTCFAMVLDLRPRHRFLLHCFPLSCVTSALFCRVPRVSRTRHVFDHAADGRDAGLGLGNGLRIVDRVGQLLPELHARRYRLRPGHDGVRLIEHR